MAEKKPVKVLKKSEGMVDELFSEVQGEINDDTVKAAKVKIKGLLVERAKAKKILDNYDRQIEELKLQIEQELG